MKGKEELDDGNKAEAIVQKRNSFQLTFPDAMLGRESLNNQSLRVEIYV